MVVIVSLVLSMLGTLGRSNAADADGTIVLKVGVSKEHVDYWLGPPEVSLGSNHIYHPQLLVYFCGLNDDATAFRYLGQPNHHALTGFARIRKGMTKQEVKDALGREPDESPPFRVGNVLVKKEYWHGTNGSIVVTYHARFPNPTMKVERAVFVPHTPLVPVTVHGGLGQ